MNFARTFELKKTKTLAIIYPRQVPDCQLIGWSQRSIFELLAFEEIPELCGLLDLADTTRKSLSFTGVIAESMFCSAARRLFTLSLIYFLHIVAL